MANAILQIVDRCTRCRGCQVACNRNMGLTADSTAEKIAADDLTVVKSQASVENPPYVKYQCWHCANPPCAAECPFGAIIKDGTTGAVTVDHSRCNPYSVKCTRQCLRNCMRGGYPKIGLGNGTDYKMWKCTMCYDPSTGTTQKNWVASTARNRYGTYTGEVPACVATCPNGALKFGDRSEIVTDLADPTKFRVSAGGGSMYWAISASPGGTLPTIFAPPTADPFAEDHVVPVVQGMLNSPAGKALVLPTLATAGLYALYKRKVQLAESK